MPVSHPIPDGSTLPVSPAVHLSCRTGRPVHTAFHPSFRPLFHLSFHPSFWVMWSMLIYFVDSGSTPDPRLVAGEIALVYMSREVYGDTV